MMRDDEDDWGKYLNSAVFSINTSVQSSTKVTPFRMMFGREARFPLQAEAESAEEIIQQVSMAEQYTLANEAEEVDEQDSMAEQYALTNEAQQANIFSRSRNALPLPRRNRREIMQRERVSLTTTSRLVTIKVLWRNMLQLRSQMEDRWLGPYVVANEPISKGTCFLLNKAV